MNELPIRKNTRLKQYDYNSMGAYFITMCTHERRTILSDIVDGTPDIAKSVGDGALDVPYVCLSKIGKVVERHLLSSEKISGVKIDSYVIMPDHIHAIVLINPCEFVKKSSGTSKAPSPTNDMLPHVVSTFKRFCNKEIGENIFQRGYFDHIIRDMDDYEKRRKYIFENPMRMYYEGKEPDI